MGILVLFCIIVSDALFLFESSARVQGQCSQVNVNTNVHILNILCHFEINMYLMCTPITHPYTVVINLSRGGGGVWYQWPVTLLLG